jgi:hypothetical protein
MSFAEDQHPVGDFGPGGEHEPFGVGVRPGLRGGIFTALMPALARTGVEGSGELAGPVADQEPELCGAVTEVHQEIPDLLCSPRPVRLCGDPEDVHASALDLDDNRQYRRRSVTAQST